MKTPFVHKHLVHHKGEAAVLPIADEVPFVVLSPACFEKDAWAIAGLRCFGVYARYRRGYVPRLKGIKITSQGGQAFWAGLPAYAKGRLLLTASLHAAETVWEGKKPRRVWQHYAAQTDEATAVMAPPKGALAAEHRRLCAWLTEVTAFRIFAGAGIHQVIPVPDHLTDSIAAFRAIECEGAA